MTLRLMNAVSNKKANASYSTRHIFQVLTNWRAGLRIYKASYTHSEHLTFQGAVTCDEENNSREPSHNIVIQRIWQ